MPTAPLHQKPALLELGRKSIRVQFAALVLVLVLPAFVGALWYMVAEREHAKQVARDNLSRLVDNFAGRLGEGLRVHQLMLSRLAARPELLAMGPTHCGSALQEVELVHPGYAGLAMFDLQGNAVCSVRPEFSAPEPLLSSAWFQQGIGAARFHASEAVLLPGSGHWVTMLSLPVSNPSGRQIGLLVLPLELHALNQSVLGKVPADALVTVTDRQANIVLRSADPQRWFGKPAPASLRQAGQREGFTETLEADGERRVLATKFLPDVGWVAAAGAREDELFAAANARLRNGVLGSVALLLLALGLGWRLAHGMVKPLDALAATAARVADGDMLARAPQEAGPRELESVARSLNRMLDARAQDQAVLRESEENLSITLQSIGDAVIATDAQGLIKRMNPTAERLTGWTLAAAAGRPLADVFLPIHPQTREPVADAVQSAMALGARGGVARQSLLVSRDAREYQIDDSAAPIRDASNQVVGIVLVFSDVTEQYQVQQALREAYNFSRQIINSLPLGLNVRDTMGRYQEWNAAMEQITGQKATQMLGQTMDHAYPTQSRVAREAIDSAIGRALAGELVVRPDLALYRAGRVQWTSASHAPLRDAAGSVVGVISIVQDISARKEVEQALRQSEENLAITLQSIGDAVIVTDTRGRIGRMNPVAEQLTGWLLADARGERLAQVLRIFNAVTGAPMADPVSQVIESGRVMGSTNHTTLLARNGVQYQISHSAAPIRDAGGQLVGVVLVFSDVTDQYRLQRVLVESEDRYRALVESSPVGVLIHQRGKMVYLNPSAVKTIGASSAQEMLGRALIDVIHPLYHAQFRSRAKATEEADAGTVLPPAEWQLIRADGAVIDVEARATVITLQGQVAVHVSFLDITARKQNETTLRENEARFRALTHLSSDWYWEQDEEFRFVRMDGNLVATTGGSAAAHIGKTRWEVGEYSLSAVEWERHRAVLNAHQEFRELQLPRRNAQGQEVWVSVSGTPIFDAAGVFRGYRGIGRDITAQKLAADQIHLLAFYDALTELPNRRLLIEQLKKALLTHARSHRQAALLFIDLDNFKTLNDTLGHETGDLLLRQVATRLLDCVREADSVARLGGDEFVVMLEDLSADVVEAATQAEQVGQKILTAFGPPFLLAGRTYRSTPSIGITVFGSGGQSVEDLLKQADLAMYQAKAAGRNTLCLFDQGMQSAVDGRAALESDLRDALARGQMVLHYQPVVLADGHVTGAETLVRWMHPLRGLVEPVEFIAVAEATRLVLPLGQWVLETACAQLASWALQPHTAHLTLAVNVSAHQFVEPDFVAQVLRAADQCGADPRKLKLELTESLLAENMEDLVEKMTALKERGIDFSLDDFGTGYSSLSYLKRLPLSQLKIDQSFVRDVLVDPNDAAIARTIVALGASLGLAVIAEGVESVGQHQFLLGIGCNAFQGYLFARPVPIAQFDAFVRDRGALAG